LLPSGKFPRIALAVALLVAALLFLNLEAVRNAAVSLLISNSLDLFIILWAALCSFFVARRSSGYPRQLWLLLGIAFSLESLAQAISTYYQSLVPNVTQTPWPSDILFFAWAAPVFMIFLPRSDDHAPGFDWTTILDFLQFAIFAVTLYLFFFYSPARWQSNQPAVLRQILTLYIVRDLILSLAFFLRSRTSHFSWLRSFSLVLGFVFLLAVLSDAVYLLTLRSSLSATSWGDLIFLCPYLLFILFAVTWKQPAPSSVSSPSRVGQLFAAQILPIAIPLFIIFMGRQIAKEQFLIPWLIVTASFACSAFRLILTNRTQRKIGRELLNIQEALRRSERMFSSAFRSSPDSMSINVFPDGPYLDVNDGFTRLTGYSREEVIGKSPTELKLWENPGRRTELFLEFVRTGELQECEFRFRTKTGQLRIGHMSGALLDLDGKRCSLVVVRDITARQAAEELLRSNEQRFRSLVEHIHVGIALYDPLGRMQFANRAALDMFGLKLDVIQGKNPKEFGIEPFYEDGTPVPDSARPVALVIASGQSQRSHVYAWRLSSTNEILWALTDTIPEFDAAGNLSRVLMSFTNITEQRKALDALRESEERFRTLVRDLHVAVVLNGPDGKIEFANQAARTMIGLPEGEILARDVTSLGLIPLDEHGRILPIEDRPIPTVLRTKRPLRSRTMGWRRPGIPETLWIFGNAIPQFNPDGSMLRVISSFTDITELKNAEQAIHQLSTQLLNLQDEERRRIGRELHDGLAQTVLAVNLSLAQVHHSDPPLGEPALRSLEKARALLQQMSREIRTLSYLLHPPLLDELGLVSALREYVRGFSERSGIETQLVLPPHFNRMPQFVEIALFRVVQESLSNIQRHSGSASATIRLLENPSSVILEIIDFGRGMHLPSDGQTLPNDAHLGVGIPGMRERIAQLGGRLDIHSTPSGTTIRATISTPQVVPKEALDGPPSHSDRG
jgi:PAS domain S-box-containing protein